MSYSNCDHDLPRHAPAGPVPGLGRVLGLLRLLVRGYISRREMRKLLERPDYQLDDIGLTREDIARALMTPYWVRTR